MGRRAAVLSLCLFAFAARAGGGETVRSTLYPADWTPGYANADGEWLPDFSYAGYRQSSVPPPDAADTPFADATQAPYNADPTGARDATAAIQRALDAAGAAGGGVVFLPAGVYRLKFPEGDNVTAALVVRHAGVALRGAGADKTRLFLDETVSRNKSVIHARPDAAIWWFGREERGTPLAADLTRPTRDVRLVSAAGFAPGDYVLLRTAVTQEWIDEHDGKGWTLGARFLRGITLPRRVVAVDAAANTVRLDAPNHYEMKTRDRARLEKIEGRTLREVGFADFSIGMKEHPALPAWGYKGEMSDSTFGQAGQPAYDVHMSAALTLTQCEDAFVLRVHSYRPDGNRVAHIHSNGIRLYYSRNVTIAACDWRAPQYRGGGGNGYLYTLSSADCLIRDSLAVDGRHNYDFQGMHATGNVIHGSTARDGLLASDFHMYLSTGNLVDRMTMDNDFWQVRYRPYGGKDHHGQSGAGNVFWNIEGQRPTGRRTFVVDTRQPRRGMVVGTRGTTRKVSWESTGLREHVGQGDRLAPPSLWRDQLDRRLAREKASAAE